MERYTRLAPDSGTSVDAASRVVDYILSTEERGRDGHIVRNSAWQLDNFQKNPVFLWGHDDSIPPIGRCTNIRIAGGALRGSVTYAETDFAETVFQLVTRKFLNAVSTSWQPIESQYMSDGSGGLLFTKVDLLEVSQVPIPALPSALATARGSINVKPLADWAQRTLDTNKHGRIPRRELEAIYRAAAPAALHSLPPEKPKMSIEEIERRLAGGDSLGMTLQERDELIARIQRVKAIKAEGNDDLRRSLLARRGPQ